MQISAKVAIIGAAVFAALCLGVAITGFLSLGDIADPQQAADARGFAWFWTFLAAVALVLGLLSWWSLRTGRDDKDA